MPKSVRPALAALLPFALVLGGCSMLPGIPGVPDPGEVGEGTLEQIIEGGSGSGVDAEVGELPAGFPADVPLVAGDVVVGFGVPGSGEDPKDAWQVTIQVADEAAAGEATRLLEAAGYTNAMVAWDNGTYFVVVMSNEADGGWHVSYIVTEQ